MGLGPGDPMLLTREAWSILQTSHEIYLRTSHHAVVDSFPENLQVHSFDYLYETCESFEDVYREMNPKEKKIESDLCFSIDHDIDRDSYRVSRQFQHPSDCVLIHLQDPGWHFVLFSFSSVQTGAPGHKIVFRRERPPLFLGLQTFRTSPVDSVRIAQQRS